MSFENFSKHIIDDKILMIAFDLFQVSKKRMELSLASGRSHPMTT